MTRSHLNNTISQNFQVSLSNQGFSFHVMRRFAEEPRIEEVHSDPEKTRKTSHVSSMSGRFLLKTGAVFCKYAYRWAPGGSSSLPLSGVLVSHWIFPEICRLLGSVKGNGCRCLSSLHSKSEKMKSKQFIKKYSICNGLVSWMRKDSLCKCKLISYIHKEAILTVRTIFLLQQQKCIYSPTV